MSAVRGVVSAPRVGRPFPREEHEDRQARRRAAREMRHAMTSSRPRSKGGGGLPAGRRTLTVRRREVLAAMGKACALLMAGSLPGGCGRFLPMGTEQAAARVARHLGFLLYGSRPPQEALAELGQFLDGEARRSLRRRLELGRASLEISSREGPVPFERLPAPEQLAAFQRIQPGLAASELLLAACRHHLRGRRALVYLDYPDSPGAAGECESLITGGPIWERYYPG